MNSILRTTDPITSNNGLDKYECEPVVGTNLNVPGDIRLYIETQNLFTHPIESFLLIEGRLTKANGTNANADNISLTNNTMMHLSRVIRYELSGQEIKKINFQGQATTMLGLLKYSDDLSKSKGLNQLWYKDTTTQANAQNVGWTVTKLYIINNSDPKGTFSFRIPLKHIFRFCEDYDKIVCGLKHSIILTRNNDENAIFRAYGVDPGEITLSKISWFMPDVIPADKDKIDLYKIIERKETLSVGYRMIQCTNA